MLFGHQTNDTNNNQIPDNVINEAAASIAPNPLATDSDTGLGVPATSDDNSATDSTAPYIDTPQTDATVPPSNSFIDDDTLGETVAPEPQELSEADANPPETPVSEDTADLLALKQQALGELTPLVNHLDQSPEEKFRTTMMMLQSTDNQSLLKDAYAAAQIIPDDKIRAQALLDVINEINYFTQQK